MMSTNKSMIRLSPYMEVVGQLVELEEHDGILLAEIAKYIIVLPIELKEVLLPHLGGRIAIIRTDIPGKEYLYRFIAEKEAAIEQDACRACPRCCSKDEQIIASCEVT